MMVGYLEAQNSNSPRKTFKLRLSQCLARSSRFILSHPDVSFKCWKDKSIKDLHEHEHTQAIPYIFTHATLNWHLVALLINKHGNL